jgi:UDP-N-acetylglucosamine--N-acetylmuramyl-(pentapeptide) pyrophosphoryl-undecaprenol N-acetylglucosamine transferase
MNRLLVAVLAAFDAVIAVAVGLAAALAPLTLLWVFAFDGGADWGSLWPAAARVWQAGHLVPLAVRLDAETVAALGIPAVYVPFPIGNGEQRYNAAGVLRAGGGVLVDDAAFEPAWVDANLLPLLADRARVAGMGERAASVGVRDGSDRMVALISRALG